MSSAAPLAEAGVKRIVYVSSVAALDYSKLPTKERFGYNPERRDMYYNSKNDGEKLALQLAAELGIELVAVLPSAMIGGEASLPLNVSYGVLKLILKKQIPVDTKITLNFPRAPSKPTFTNLRHFVPEEACSSLFFDLIAAQSHLWESYGTDRSG